MVRLENTLLEEVEESFVDIFAKIESYQSKLKGSIGYFETDKYVENLIKSQRLMKKLSVEANKSLDVLIEEYYSK